MEKIKNNIGYFEIPLSIFHSLDESTLKSIFSKLIPVGITDGERHNVKRYTCVSSLFETVKDGDEIPQYDIVIEGKRDNGKLNTEFKVNKL